ALLPRRSNAQQNGKKRESEYQKDSSNNSHPALATALLFVDETLLLLDPTTFLIDPTLLRLGPTLLFLDTALRLLGPTPLLLEETFLTMFDAQADELFFIVAEIGGTRVPPRFGFLQENASQEAAFITIRSLPVPSGGSQLLSPHQEVAILIQPVSKVAP